MLVIAKTSKKDVKQQVACTVISTKPNEWVKLVCNVPGCKEGYISVDGMKNLSDSRHGILKSTDLHCELGDASHRKNIGERCKAASTHCNFNQTQ